MVSSPRALAGPPFHLLRTLKAGLEAVAVSAVERPYELGRLATRVERSAREHQERHAGLTLQERSVATLGDDRFDGLFGRCELDAVVRREQLIQRPVVAEGGGDAVEAIGVEVQHFDGDGIAVGETKSLDAQHLGLRRESELSADVETSRNTADVDELGARHDAALSHSLGVAHQLKTLFDLRPCDERALALAAKDALFEFKLAEGLANGRARDAERQAQFALGRHGGACGESFDRDEK